MKPPNLLGPSCCCPTQCWHVNHTCVPASPHQPKLAIPWPCAGPGGQTLRQAPALAARRPATWMHTWAPDAGEGQAALERSPHRPTARTHQVKRSEGQAALECGPHRPTAGTHRVKRSAVWGSRAPLKEASEATDKVGTPP